MKYDDLSERLGALEDVQFYGFSWDGNDLKLKLGGPGTSNYSAVICHWAYSLVVNLSWADPKHKRSGPLLSLGGSLKKSPETGFELIVNFGSGDFISLNCNDITLVE